MVAVVCRDGGVMVHREFRITSMFVAVCACVVRKNTSKWHKCSQAVNQTCSLVDRKLLAIHGVEESWD